MFYLFINRIRIRVNLLHFTGKYVVVPLIYD